MIFSKNNLTTLFDHPDHYLIEFHDILTFYLGQILPMPTDSENETINFILLNDKDSFSDDEISSLNVASRTKIHHQPSLSKKEYSKYFNQLLSNSLDDLEKKSDPNSRQAFSILRSFDSKWFVPNNIIIIKNHPLLKCWGLESRYLTHLDVKSMVIEETKNKFKPLKSMLSRLLFPKLVIITIFVSLMMIIFLLKPVSPEINPDFPPKILDNSKKKN